MKIVNFQGGMGNQMFIYTFYLYLRRQRPKERIYGCYLSGSLREHSRFMLEQVFDVTLPPRNAFSDILSRFCSLMERLHLVSLDEGKHSIFYDGFWLDKKYLDGIDAARVFKFRSTELTGANAIVKQEILSSQSVSLHIRRGDYLNTENKRNFGDYSSMEYYKRAIANELAARPGCKFFVFSDDPQWAKENLSIPDATFVDANTGDSSWKDMYLMSLCKDNIIANSTFSWWAATLNQNAGKRVLYPRKWYYWNNPDIFPENWIAVENL